MLNKFYDDGSGELPDKKVVDVMSGWADMLHAHREHRNRLVRILGTISYNAGREEQVMLANALVNKELPELGTASTKLSEAFQGLYGWNMKWRQYVRGDVIGAETTERSEGFIAQRLVRAPAEFHEDEGVLLDSIVGANPVFLDYGVWVGIGYAPEQRVPAFMNFSEMLEVQFVPPEQG